jgi:hypothetical protein
MPRWCIGPPHDNTLDRTDMASAKYLQIVAFLTRHLERLHHRGGTGSDLNFPEFDLMPFDYLEFAEQELDRSSTASRINCIGHLKRAVECELDTLLGVLSVAKCVPNFPRKLEFANDVGIISSRSLGKLNQMRNRMEHEYAVPEVAELEMYFDLANGFVHTVEGYIFMLSATQSMEWCADTKNPTAALGVEIDMAKPRVIFGLEEDGTDISVTFEVSAFAEYCEGLKIFFLLCRANGLLSAEYVLAKLQGKAFHA